MIEICIGLHSVLFYVFRLQKNDESDETLKSKIKSVIKVMLGGGGGVKLATIDMRDVHELFVMVWLLMLVMAVENCDGII